MCGSWCWEVWVGRGSRLCGLRLRGWGQAVALAGPNPSNEHSSDLFLVHMTLPRGGVGAPLGDPGALGGQPSSSVASLGAGGALEAVPGRRVSLLLALRWPEQSTAMLEVLGGWGRRPS